jgi:homoserine acetyltransferase
MDKSHRRPRYSCLTGQSSVPWVTGARGKPGDPEHKAAASCLVCGQLLQRKQTGRVPKYCGAKCRDRAREGRFPHYNYDDMVVAQYQLVSQGPGLRHLRLVLGHSMGG